ncbi:hypothetical protein PO909_021219 [Leuciscus waleckii]
MEVLLSEVEGRKKVLFGGLSAGISNKRKILEWEQVTEAVNAVTSVPRTVQETKKKWSDLKVVVKKRICAHRRSVVTTGGGQGITDLSAFDARVGAIIGETGLSGVLPEFQSDTDVICATSSVPPSSNAQATPSCAQSSASSSSSSSSSSSFVPPPSAGNSRRVLTEEVMQTQRHMVHAVNAVCSELKEIKTILSEISGSLKELVKK